MKEYFEIQIYNLDKKIDSWNDKNFFQKLFAKEKWSDEHTFKELEKIFHVGELTNIKSQDDFNTYLKYYLKYYKGLSYETSISINKKLIELCEFNPEMKFLLSESLEAQQVSHNSNQQVMNILNSMK